MNKFFAIIVRAIGVLIITIIFQVNLRAQKPLLWNDLEPGPYAVGFKVIYRHDFSRTWKARYDFDGQLDIGTRARPIRISVWYPAIKRMGATSMIFRDYVHLRTQNASFAELNELLERREVNLLRRVIRGEAAFNQLLATRVGADLDALPRRGSFPLVAYSSGLNESWQHANFVLCEYLASHGYVVITVPQLGQNSLKLNLGINPAALETQVRDLEFAIGALHDFSNVDVNRLAAMGHSMGGVAALVLQMRNTDVGAVIGLDASYGTRSLASTLTQSVYYNPERMSAPLLDLRRPNDERDMGGVEAFKYADRFFLEFPGITHADFTSFPMIALHFPTDIQGRTAESASRDYQLVCRYVLNFLDGYLKGDMRALSFMQSRPEANTINPEIVRYEFHRATRPALTVDYFVSAVLRYGFQKTAQRFGELDDESLLNNLGYRLLELQRSEQAIEAFELNVKKHPRSANAYDSLAEAYWLSGNKAQAISAYERVLDLLPTDPNLREEERNSLKKNALARLEELRP
ncbi:MAG: hypothetical protein QOH25_2700 [Acidobacteriota bacterium]|jgi:pimeloyl-ACP methyl ester carboxylesterase|nr:hypothetical protein [Acidobacteriota bacterium]